MRAALDETQRRRQKQFDHNKRHNIKPKSISKDLSDILSDVYDVKSTKAGADPQVPNFSTPKQKEQYIKRLERDMLDAADRLEFEKAAQLRDRLSKLQKQELL